MSVNDIKMPDNIMDNVEKKLRTHINAKKKRRNLYAASLALILALGLPASVLAYNNYVKNVPYIQEIDLARQNNTISKLDATFKYKDVEFKFKEAVADETGMVILYEVSDPKYSIKSMNLKDIEVHPPISWGYSYATNDETQKEKVFLTEVRGDTFIHMKDNPITIKIDKIINSSKDKEIAVDWSLKMQVPVQRSKIIPINKEYKLELGTMKLKTLNIGALKTYIDYEFISIDKNKISFSPTFAYRIDNMNTIISSNILDNNTGMDLTNTGEEFKSLYYSTPKEIGITLIGASVNYKFDDSEKYYIDKTKLPMEFDFKGEKGRVVSMNEKDGYVEYIFEFDKSNRNYSYINFIFGESSQSSTNFEDIKFINQDNIDKLYKELSKKIPGFEKKFSSSNFNKGAVSLKVTVPEKDSGSFTIFNADKEILLNLDEIIIRP